MKRSIIKKSYLIFLISLTVSCQTKTDNIEVYKTDTYLIRYPSSLELDKSKADGTEFMLFTEKTSETDNFIENINLIVRNHDASLKEYVKKANTEVAKIATIIESEVIDNNNLKIHKILFEITEDNINMTVLQHSLIVNNKVFVLTFCGKSVEFNKYQSEMENIMLSFKLLKHDNYIRPRRL